MRRFLYTLPIAAILFSATALAQDNPLKRVPESLPPALKYLEQSGVKLTYLGEEGGLSGYLGENPTGKVQTFYLTPDGNHVVAGIMFRRGGINVTGVQIEDMRNRFEDASKRLDDVEGDVEDATLDAPYDEPPVLPELPDYGTDGFSSSADPGASGTDSQATGVAVPNPYLSDIEAETFLEDAASVAWFSVGVEDAPVVYMVADPQCPFCHAAWRELRPLVMERQINLRIVLIDALNGSRDKAISLLVRDEPGRAWFAGEGSVQGMAIKPAPESESEEYREGAHYLQVNRDFADHYGFDATPFLVYEAKDGALRASRGVPTDFDLFLSDL